MIFLLICFMPMLFFYGWQLIAWRLRKKIWFTMSVEETALRLYCTTCACLWAVAIGGYIVSP